MNGSNQPSSSSQAAQSASHVENREEEMMEAETAQSARDSPAAALEGLNINDTYADNEEYHPVVHTPEEEALFQECLKGQLESRAWYFENDRDFLERYEDFYVNQSEEECLKIKEKLLNQDAIVSVISKREYENYMRWAASKHDIHGCEKALIHFAFHKRMLEIIDEELKEVEREKIEMEWKVEEKARRGDDEVERRSKGSDGGPGDNEDAVEEEEGEHSDREDDEQEDEEEENLDEEDIEEEEKEEEEYFDKEVVEEEEEDELEEDGGEGDREPTYDYEPEDLPNANPAMHNGLVEEDRYEEESENDEGVEDKQEDEEVEEEEEEEEREDEEILGVDTHNGFKQDNGERAEEEDEIPPHEPDCPANNQHQPREGSQEIGGPSGEEEKEKMEKEIPHSDCGPLTENGKCRPRRQNCRKRFTCRICGDV